MKLSSVNSINFTRVVGVYGPKKKIDKVYYGIKNKHPYGKLERTDATQYYRCALPGGVLSNAAAKGDNIALFVTGQADCEQLPPNREFGWDDVASVSYKLSKAYDAREMTKEDREEIIESMYI